MYPEGDKWIGEALLVRKWSINEALYKVLMKACLNIEWKRAERAAPPPHLNLIPFLRRKIGLKCRALWFWAQIKNLSA